MPSSAQIVSLYESTLAYVEPCLSLEIDSKNSKPYGLWAEKKVTAIKFQDPIFADGDDDEDEDADSTFAPKSTRGSLGSLRYCAVLYNTVLAL